MPPIVPTVFLNLDLVVKSRSDPGVVIKHFGESAFVLSHHEFDGEWTLVLELVDDNFKDPGTYTQRFLAIISEFPDQARDAWKACTSRTFSYGFEGGSNSSAFDTTISADLLLQIAQVGADIGITVYPWHQP